MLALRNRAGGVSHEIDPRSYVINDLPLAVPAFRRRRWSDENVPEGNKIVRRAMAGVTASLTNTAMAEQGGSVRWRSRRFMFYRRFFLILLLAGFAPSFLACGPDDQYRLGPDSEVQQGVPQGTVRELALPPSKVYPGYKHQAWLYVPLNILDRHQ